MNVAFKHLEAKLRFGELSIGQWAAILGGVLFALVFAQYLSPVGGLAAVDHRRLPRRDPGQRGVLGQPERVRPVGAARRGAALAAQSTGRYVPGAGETRARLRAARRRAGRARGERTSRPSTSASLWD